MTEKGSTTFKMKSEEIFEQISSVFNKYAVSESLSSIKALVTSSNITSKISVSSTKQQYEFLPCLPSVISFCRLFVDSKTRFSTKKCNKNPPLGQVNAERQQRLRTGRWCSRIFWMALCGGRFPRIPFKQIRFCARKH